MVFTTDICFCVQQEEEITLAYEGEINVVVDYKRRETLNHTDNFNNTRTYYSIPATVVCAKDDRCDNTV